MSLLTQAYFQRHSNNTFTLFGPWYSLLYEPAKKLNYSMTGLQAEEKSSEEEIINDFVRFQPDVVFIPFNPRVDVLMRIYNFGLTKIRNIIYVVESDHILSAVKYKSKSLMSILAPFDPVSLILMIFGLILISFLSRNFKQKFIKNTFNDIIWYLLTTLIYIPQINTKKDVWRFVGLCWTVGVYLLQHLFSGEMYTSMTLSSDLDVIDTFEDLIQKTSGPITVFMDANTNANDYFSQNQTFRTELSKRLKIIALDKMFSLNVAVELIDNVTSGKQYHVGNGDLVDYYRNTLFDGRFKESLYISNEFGYPVPHFIPFGSMVEPLVLQTFDKM